jgi:hypothetical protein
MPKGNPGGYAKKAKSRTTNTDKKLPDWTKPGYKPPYNSGSGLKTAKYGGPKPLNNFTKPQVKSSGTTMSTISGWTPGHVLFNVKKKKK